MTNTGDDRIARSIPTRNLCDKWCMRYDRSDASLCHDIKHAGVVVPLLVCKDLRGNHILISGHKRLWCARQLKKKKVPAIIFDKKKLTKRELILMALRSNHPKTLSDLDKSVALSKVKTCFNFHTNEDRACLARLLDLPPSEKVFSEYISVLSLYTPLVKHIAQGDVSFRGAMALTHFSKEEQRGLYTKMLAHTSFSASELKQVGTFIKNIMKRERISLATLLRQVCKNRLPIKEMKQKDRNTFYMTHLKERAYPILSHLTKKIKAIEREAQLGKNIMLTYASHFEDSTYQLGICFSSKKELQKELLSLEKRIDTLGKLFTIDTNLTLH